VWWDNFMLGIVLPEEWKENFRMSQDSFFFSLRSTAAFH
jgi:hypothetical protein